MQRIDNQHRFIPKRPYAHDCKANPGDDDGNQKAGRKIQPRTLLLRTALPDIILILKYKKTADQIVEYKDHYLQQQLCGSFVYAPDAYEQQHAEHLDNQRTETHPDKTGRFTKQCRPGARPVLNAFLEEVAKRELKNVTVSQTGCIGVCRLEPIVEVYVPGQEKVTYVKMTPDKVASIVSEHLVNGRVVTEYTIGAAE